uniref:Uncharacterized protein n=1 Tax=Coccolithus braarudii TaxID=221442 RepID=A0A7S0LJC9_9EUKA|mmetsp:Transcript_41487/g.88500  ORF Transcript_41487/g.88500 Transcript_41487/m.88500 type:complete len:210 (+) Transcript_41487:169-798(+)
MTQAAVAPMCATEENGPTVVELMSKLDTGDDVEGTDEVDASMDVETNPFQNEESTPLHLKLTTHVHCPSPEMMAIVNHGPAISELEEDEIVNLEEFERPSPAIPELDTAQAPTTVPATLRPSVVPTSNATEELHAASADAQAVQPPATAVALPPEPVKTDLLVAQAAEGGQPSRQPSPSEGQKSSNATSPNVVASSGDKGTKSDKCTMM